jgi:hypothetical protein
MVVARELSSCSREELDRSSKALKDAGFDANLVDAVTASVKSDTSRSDYEQAIKDRQDRRAKFSTLRLAASIQAEAVEDDENEEAGETAVVEVEKGAKAPPVVVAAPAVPTPAAAAETALPTEDDDLEDDEDLEDEAAPEVPVKKS